jgi:hypothetical protein
MAWFRADGAVGATPEEFALSSQAKAFRFAAVES